jgi:hypothetical protein
MRLPPTLHAAVVGDDVVLLQTDRDRYLCLPGTADRLRLSGDGREVGWAPPELAAALQEQASGGGAESDAFSWGPPVRPTADLATGTARARPGDLLRLVLATRDLLPGYVGRPMGQVLARVRRRPTGRSAPCEDGELRRLVGVFNRWAPFLPIPGKCLIRSFVLLRFLQRSGRNAEWAIGVRLWPFSAHCWLQVGETALDDRADDLRLYTPILRA